jgi:LysR family glycine cleavage system transcriptional activator
MRQAAQELGVTHGAVSRQVKQLEEVLGVDLFNRSHNRLNLTAAGRRLMSTVGDALDRITESTLYLDPESVAGSLVVGATPSIITGWLLGLIRRFNERYPEIELRVVNLDPQASDLPAEISVAICFGEPDVPQRMCDIRWSTINMVAGSVGCRGNPSITPWRPTTCTWKIRSRY